MSSPGRGRRPPFAAPSSSSRPILNLNRPGQASRQRSEDQQPSEATLSNRRPTAPPTIFPLSQVPTGPRSTPASRTEPPIASSGMPNRPRQAAVRGKSKKRYVVGGWASSSSASSSTSNASGFTGLPTRDAGWGSRAAASSSSATGFTDKGKSPMPGRSEAYPSRPPNSAASGGSNSVPTPIPVPTNPRCTLYVTGLPSYTTEQDLRATFSPYGTVTRVSVKSPKPTYAFAHITFAEAAEALAAYEALDGKQPEWVSAPPSAETIGAAEAGSSRGMKVAFSETAAERNARRMSGGEAPPVPPGLFRMPQTPDLASTQAESEVKPEPSPSPQKAPSNAPRQDARPTVRGGPSYGPRDPSPSRIELPKLVVQGKVVPKIGLGTWSPPDERIWRPTYYLMYNYIRPLRSQPQRELIEELGGQLWRDHGRMRIEEWSIEPRFRTTAIKLRVSIPPETLDLYRLPDKRQGDGPDAALPPQRPADNLPETESRPPPMSIDAPPSGVDTSSNVFDDLGVAHFRAPLPETARGTSAEAVKQRRLFLIAQAKQLGADGDKVVMSSRIEGDEVVVEYMQDDAAVADKADEEASTVQVVDERVAVAVHARPGHSSEPAADTDGMEDVKPAILVGERPAEPPATAPTPTPVPSRAANFGSIAVPSTDTAMWVDSEAGHEDEEVDELATPPPAPDAARFPLPALAESRADSKETYSAVTSFITEYFRRFDESRSSLESFYTPNALFSIKINDHLPDRLLSPPVNFSPQWLAARNKVASTPVAITNMIRTLPAVSHNVDSLTFTARTVPELYVKSKTRAPIVLHGVGQFEEFLEKTVRSFSRTFIIVPRPSKTMGGASDGYLVHSDQITIAYHVRGEPSPLLVQQPPFSPPKRPAANPPALAAPPTVRAASSAAATPSARPFSQFQPHPALARMQEPVAGPSRPTMPAESSPAAASTSRRTEAGTGSHRVASSSPPARQLSSAATVAVVHGNNDSDSAHTSVSPEVERRPLPSTPSRPASRQSAAALGKRRADEEAVQLQRRKKRSAGEAVSSALETTSQSTATAAEAASGTGTQSYTAEDVRKMVAQEVAAQLARAAGSVRGPSPRSDDDDEPIVIDDDDETIVIASNVASSSKHMTNRAKSSTNGKAARATAAATEAVAETQKRKQQEKAKAAAVKAGPPLGTGLGASDARILFTGASQSLLHGFDGRSNKLRHMVDTGSSYLAVSHIGDIVEFTPSPLSLSTSVHKLHSSSNDTYRVDDFAWSDAKDTLVVGYLGAREGKMLAQPPNQVILYKREPAANGSRLVERKVDLRPHKSGGVTALATLPGSGRLRFVTGGEDKKIYLWSRSRATQEYTADEIRSDHSSMITSLAHMPERNWLVSSGKDKRLKGYDLEHLNSTWQALLHDPVMTVQPLSSDPNLVLARMASSRDQFAVYDVRRPATASAILTFGYDLAPHRSSKGALVSTNMGRYIRGDQCDTIFAFPDHAQGVKLWDLRNVRVAQTPSDLKRQDAPDLGRGKVVQVAFRGRTEMCLMDMSHVTRVAIRG